jgi:predicted nucleic acid-binding protein
MTAKAGSTPTGWEQRDHLLLVNPTVAMVTDVARLIEPKDAPIVAGAITAGASYLVSYDRRQLLSEAGLIRQQYGIEVATPDYAVARIAESSY